MNVREFITGIVVGLEEGGPGSGHWGHRGVPGQRGGSLPGAFSVKATPSGAVQKYLAMISWEQTKAEDDIAALQKMVARKQVDEEHAQAIREAICRNRYARAVYNKRIAMTPSALPKPLQGAKLANSEADSEEAEANGRHMYRDIAVRPNNANSRAVLKNEICEKLAERSGLPYEEVNRRIGQWAKTSNDTSAKALSMQEAARREFGSKLSPWQKNQWKESGAGKMISAEEMKMNRRLLRAMYEETQEHLRSLGVPADGFVTLYRGVKLSGKWPKGEKVVYEGNALESWSLISSTAASFGDRRQFLTANIPASRIVSTATTGFGCLTESEVVVLGGLGPLEAIAE